MNKNKEESIEDLPSELHTTQYLIERIKQLQSEVESLRIELRNIKRIPSGKIGIALIIPGIISLVYSIILESQILAFIGLSLTFWGTLFFFIKPIRYVKGDLLDSAAISSYSTINRIIRDLKVRSKGYYIPPYPKNVYLPEHLKGLKEMIVFIPARSKSDMPSIEEMARSKFLLKNPSGICISPPGIGLLTLLEKELGREVSEMEFEAMAEVLPSIITETLQLASEVEIKGKGKYVYLRISDSIYRNLYSEGSESVHFLGCPLASALVCAIAKNTGKIVTIQRSRLSLDKKTVEFWCRFVEG